MQIGVGLPSFASEGHAIPPDRFRRYARSADEYGFAGCWAIEHLIRPPSYDTSLFDPLATLSMVAGETETIPVGTSVLLLPLRNPVMVAKRAATIQHLSSRRLTLGLGTGYVREEFDAVGVPMAERSARYLEGIELLRRLLSEEVVTFDGEFYSVEEFRLEPALGQRPRVRAGGGGVETDAGRRGAEGVKARFDHADGWIAPPRQPEVLEEDWAALAERIESDGRDPSGADKVALQYLHLVPGEDADAVRREQRNAYREIVGPDRTVERATENWLTGTVDDVLATLAEYERQGFEEVVLHPVARTPDRLDRQLRLYRELIAAEFP
jgi:alkanesulfonate monooxygenase